MKHAISQSSARSLHLGAALTARSNPEFLVNLQIVSAAMVQVMVNEPENIEGIEQHIVVVVKFERAIQKENCFHSVGVVGNQGMNHAGILPHVTAGPRDPVVLDSASSLPACRRRWARDGGGG